MSGDKRYYRSRIIKHFEFTETILFREFFVTHSITFMRKKFNKNISVFVREKFLYQE